MSAIGTGERWGTRGVRRLAIAAAVTGVAGLALLVSGAAQAADTFPVRIVPVDAVDPGDAAHVLDVTGGVTFDEVQSLLDDLRSGEDADAPILVPLGIPGLDAYDLPSTTVTVDDDAEALVLRSGTELNGSTVEASVVVDWADADDVDPEVALVVHGTDIGIATLAPDWPDDGITPTLDDAWVLLTPRPHTLDGAGLQDAIGDAVPDEVVDLTAGVTFRATVDAGDGALGDVVRAAGLDPSTIALGGSFGVDAGVLSGDVPTFSISGSVGVDPDGPAWLLDAAADLELSLGPDGASVHVGGAYTVDLGDGVPQTFTADASADASRTGASFELALSHEGDLQLPAPLDWLVLGDASLAVRYDDGLTATLHGEAAVGDSSIDLDANLAVTSGGVSLDLAVTGPVSAVDVARVLGQPLGGFDDAALAGLDGVELDALSFSFATDATGTRLSGTGAGHLRGAELSVLLSALDPATGPARLLAGLHLSGDGGECCATLGDLLGPDIGPAADIEVPSIDLVYLSGNATLGAADLVDDERAFFTGVHGDDLGDLAVRPGLSLASRVPLSALDPVILDLLGVQGSDQVVIEGYVGSAVGAVGGTGPRDLTGLDLKIDLPPSTGSSLLPDWLQLESDWDLQIKAVQDAIAMRASAEIHAAIADQEWDAELVATFEDDPSGVRASLEATLGPWEDPFGLEWFDLDGVHVVGRVERPTGGSTTASVSAEAGFSLQIGSGEPKRFTVEVAAEASDTVRGTFTAKLLDPISLGDVLEAIQAPVGDSMPAQLSGTSVGPVSISASVGGGQPPTLSVFAHGHVQFTADYGAGANLLATIAGTTFTLGVRPDAGLSLADIFPPDLGLPPQMDVELPNIAMAVTNGVVSNVDDDALTDEEQAFWAPIYGCDPDDLSACEYRHTLPAGVSGIASMGLPSDLQTSLDPFHLDFSQPAMMRGTLPIFGGSFNPNITIKLPAPRSDLISEFFEDASLFLHVDRNGLTIGGELALRMPRYGEGPGEAIPCRNELVSIPIRQDDGTYEDEDRCFDVLRFGMEGTIIWNPSIALALTGTFNADGADGWMSPFGVGDWIGVKRLAAQLSIIPSTRTFGIGFLADFRLLGKDMAGSISLGVNILPNAPWVMPELLGFRLSSSRGLSFGDLVDLQHDYAQVASLVAGVPAPPKLDLAAAGLPDLALRNLDLMYARQSNPALCLETGLVIAADLYVNPTESGDAPIYDGDGKCRVLPSQMNDQSMTPECVRQKPNGCFASVMLSVTLDGILGAGNVAAFDLGPIHWHDAYVDLALTLNQQHLALKGGAALDGVFTGDLELKAGLQGFKLQGDVDLFNGAGGAYIEAEGALDLAELNPHLHILATMNGDFEDDISAAIDVGVAPIRTAATALDVLWDTVLDLSEPGRDSVETLRSLPQRMRDAGLSVPPAAELIVNTIADIEGQLKVLGTGSVLVDAVLNGVQLPDFPGWRIDLVPKEPTCLGWTVNGGCWLIPPIHYDSYTWWNLFCWCDVFVPEHWDYSIAIPAIVAQPTCVGTYKNGVCWALGLEPFSFPQVPGVCDLTPGLTEADLGRRCTLRDVMEKVVGPAVGSAISTVTGQPAPANLSQFLDQIVGGLKAAGGAVKVECATFKLDVGGGLTNPSAKTEVALAMNLFGTPMSFGAAWDFANPGGSIAELPTKVIDQLIHPTPVSCEKKVSSVPPTMTLTGTDRINEDGTQTVTGTFASAGDRTVTLEWGDGVTQTVATSGATFTASHRYLDDDPSGAPSESYVVKASYVDGETKVGSSKLMAVANVVPSGLAIDVSSVVEGGTATLTGSFADPGTKDTHQVVVTWGDGSQPVTLDLTPGARSFTTSHPFPASGSYPLTVVVLDDDTGRTSKLGTIEVANAAPTNVAVALDDADIDEGGIATLQGSFDDAGTDDRHTVTVEWGDGTAPETLQLPVDGRTFSLGHRYVDDTDGDVLVTVADDDGGSASTSTPILVHNVAPVDAHIGTPQGAVGESTNVTFSGSFVDPGIADAHTVVIDWGTGAAPTTIELPPGESQFTTTYLYADDDPTATASDLHGVQVTVTDDDEGIGEGSSEITIANSTPSALTLVPDAVRIDEGSSVVYRGSFLDAGLLDDHTVTVDWGDGTAPSVLSIGSDAVEPFTPSGADERDPGLRRFSLAHTYADDALSHAAIDDYPVTLTVADDDTGTSVLDVVVPVHDVAPSQLDLALAASTIDEDGVAALSGTFTDPGTPDTHTVVVDWGDGTALQTIELDGERELSATHRYLDDAPTATPSDVFHISVGVTDDDTLATAAGIDVRVDDVAPSGVTFTPQAAIDEGSSVRWDGAFADPGSVDGHTVLVAWGDGLGDTVQLPVGARTFSLEHTYVDDDPTGSATDAHDVTVAVVDDDTLLATLTAEHVIGDVAPSALALTVAPATFAEDGTTNLSGTFADPGARDTFTVVVDWGEGTVDTQSLPAGTLSFAAAHQYGDDGTFPIRVLVTDDDTLSTTASTAVTVTNVAPSAGIDRVDPVWVGAAGGPTVTARATEARTFSAHATDPGSDDLTFTWTWGDGTTSTGSHRNVPDRIDPDPSPTVGPRSVTDTQTHAWSTPCLYAVPMAVGDDDGGAAPLDSGWVIVTGTSGVRHGTGWWHSRYDGKGNNDLPAAVQACYLRIAGHASAVFGDARTLATNADAAAILTGAGSDPRDQLDRVLLSLWLDYADGGFRWGDAVDTDGNRRADAVFADVMRAAEWVRLDPSSTKKALQDQRQRLQHTTLPGQQPPSD
jgi:hypothetical protein